MKMKLWRVKYRDKTLFHVFAKTAKGAISSYWFTEDELPDVIAEEVRR